MTELNKRQKELIEKTEGIYLVDAGAGTGKTFAITKRYEYLLKKGIKPKDILLVTFTNNAAESMRDKIINSCARDYPIKDLLDAPISTFHSFCNKLLKQYGSEAPSLVGIEETLSTNYQIMENGVIEQRMFQRFFNRFQKRNSKRYSKFFPIVYNKSHVMLRLIKKLCCNGVLPKKKGWFGNGYELLVGDLTKYREIFEKVNEPRKTAKGNRTDSAMAASFKGKLRYKHYIDRPPEEHIFIDKKIRPELVEKAFNEDREDLINFIHDLYFGYLKLVVRKNRLNFDFLVMLTFVLLHARHDLRKNIAFDYVMVDEFQDTNEVQFMLTLLLMKKSNLCAVGDWKQGIYGFRNATIENVMNFDKRISYYKDVLNRDIERVEFPVSHEKISFDINYRSSQEILDFSERALFIKGSKYDSIDGKRIKEALTSLRANQEMDNNTSIEFVRVEEKEDEYYAILQKVQKIVDNPDYKIKENGKERKVKYGDIAILSRTRTFGLKLQDFALRHNIPFNYDGGIELFKTEPAILLLGWLKVLLNKEKVSGWIPILENEGYDYSDILAMLCEDKEIPNNLIAFREKLESEKSSISLLTDKILNFYNFDDVYANALVVELEKLFSGTLMSISDLVYFIEENILTGQTYNIDINNSDNAVIVETIHAAKGLEYPVVFVVDCNESRFPSRNYSRPSMFYDEIIGLRSRKHAAKKNNYDYIFNDISTDFLLTRLNSDYDEERRLLYVAITRAKQYLVFTGNRKASPFFTELSGGFEVENVGAPDVKEGREEKEKAHDEIKIGNYEKTRNKKSVKDFLDIKPCGGKKGHGDEIHLIAEKIALGKKIKKDSQEIRNLKNFILSQKGELYPEIKCSIPHEDQIILGKIDLLVVGEKIKIIDYKTDEDERNLEQYRKQLSFYYLAVREEYPDREIICNIFYTKKNKVETIVPLPLKELFDF